MARYAKTSLYSATKFRPGGILDTLEYKGIPFAKGDLLYEIRPQYNYRPDLLASDLYSDPNLWWVFMSRNPAVIEDPIFDFVAGVKIYIPNIDLIRQVVGGA
jgi:hypothetical protein